MSKIQCIYCGEACYAGELDADFAELFVADIEALRYGQTPHRWFPIWMEMAAEIGCQPTDAQLRYNIIERMLVYILNNYSPVFCIRLATLLYSGAKWSEVAVRLRHPSHYYTVLLLMYSGVLPTLDDTDMTWSTIDDTHKMAVRLHYLMAATGGAIKIEFHNTGL